MIRIQRDSHMHDGRNWDMDPVALVCLHGERYAGWGAAKQEACRRLFFDGIREGKEVHLGDSPFWLHVYPPSADGMGNIYLNVHGGGGECVGVKDDQSYVYEVVPDGIDAIEYDRSLNVARRKAPDLYAIGRFLLEATGHYVDDRIQDGAIDDLLNWFTLDQLEGWYEREAYATSGMRGPGVHALHAFGRRVRARKGQEQERKAS